MKHTTEKPALQGGFNTNSNALVGRLNISMDSNKKKDVWQILYLTRRYNITDSTARVVADLQGYGEAA